MLTSFALASLKPLLSIPKIRYFDLIIPLFPFAACFLTSACIPHEYHQNHLPAMECQTGQLRSARYLSVEQEQLKFNRRVKIIDKPAVFLQYFPLILDFQQVIIYIVKLHHFRIKARSDLTGTVPVHLLKGRFFCAVVGLFCVFIVPASMCFNSASLLRSTKVSPGFVFPFFLCLSGFSAACFFFKFTHLLFYTLCFF